MCILRNPNIAGCEMVDLSLKKVVTDFSKLHLLLQVVLSAFPFSLQFKFWSPCFMEVVTV